MVFGLSNPAIEMNSNVEGPNAEESEFTDAVLKYISQTLMEEDIENETCIIQDSAFQAAEKSFYDILGEKYPSSSNQNSPYQNEESPVKSYTSHGDASYMTESSITSNLLENESSTMLAPPLDYTLQSHLQSSSLLVCPPGSAIGGIKRAKELVSSCSNQLVFDFENSRLIPMELLEDKNPVVKAASKKYKKDHSRRKLREGKNHNQQVVSDSEMRSNKHFAVSTEKDGQSKGSNGETMRRKRQINKRNLVDLRTLLIHSAEAVANNDNRSANELLEQIRQHSSPFGDGSQRLSHYFANGLEARLAGTGSEVYAALAGKKMPASSMLKAFRFFVSACPFMKMSDFFAIQTILNLAEKATRLHIIHFGILHGFQWPGLIQLLSTRPGGPPVLRITGIDLPQPGCLPAARVEETGRVLASYCKIFGVPFEYNPIAQNWETIKLEDLKIDRNGVIVVNCLYWFRYVLDETVLLNCPRDVVLNLIKRINPHVFIHGIVNGAYNAPFFASRFREALYYFSAVFDMFEANATREDKERNVFEEEIYGREILNVIACEGSNRVERPEKYKDWQVRNLRAGFRQLPLDQEIMKNVREKVKSCYRREFLVDEDRQWMIQGWKGKILFALSCWRVA